MAKLIKKMLTDNEMNGDWKGEERVREEEMEVR